MLSQDHAQAHDALDMTLEALLNPSPTQVMLRLFDFKRQLLAHMKQEERHLLGKLPGATATAISKDHDDLRARLKQVEEAALDATVGAVPLCRLEDEIARLLALMEHHDLREAEAYARVDGDVAWPAPPRSVGPSLPREAELAVARYAWWHRARQQDPADWQPTLPPSLSTDDAMLAVTLRETELLRAWLAVTPGAPGRARLTAAHRLTASLRATVGFTLRRAVADRKVGSRAPLDGTSS